MISLGIVSVQENPEKRNIFKRIPVEITKSLVGDFPLIVANVFCEKKCFLKNIFLKKYVFWRLKKSGAQVVCIEEEETKNFCRELYKSEIKEAVSYALRYLQGSPIGKTIWFSDVWGENIDSEILCLVSHKAENIGIVTKNVSKAEMIAEELCNEYGVNIEIQEEKSLITGGALMVVDFDTKKIRIGHDFLIDGREFTLNLQGYHIDVPWLLAKCPDFSSNLIHEAWLFGKKRLTR